MYRNMNLYQCTDLYLCVHIHVWICIHILYTYIYRYIHIEIYVYVFKYTYTYIYIHIYIQLFYIYVDAYMSISMCIYMCTYVCVYLYYIYMKNTWIMDLLAPSGRECQHERQEPPGFPCLWRCWPLSSYPYRRSQRHARPSFIPILASKLLNVIH